MSLEQVVRVVDSLESLLTLLRDELDWPLPEHPDFEELTFEWSPEDLRLSEKTTAHNVVVRQLRPFTERQPWGIFFVEFEKNIYRTALRQVLRGLVPNRRKASSLRSWHHENLLFICTTRDYDRFTFAHFRGEKAGRAVLTTFGWERGETALRTLCEYNLSGLRFPDDPDDVKGWLHQWRSAFDVQAVTDAFFRDYEHVFAELQRLLYERTQDKVWAHDYALQLLNRLMFLYFIQRKSTKDGRYWLGNDRRFIRSFWEAYRASGERDAFLKKWLGVLFFEAFNERFSPKPYLPKELNEALRLAPFLNGGLFRKGALDEQHSVELPDGFFELLFDRFQGTTPGFLERYNFTISENTPLDREVAVDPEMIGKVYESLVNITFEGLEAEDRRGRAGIFYTPRVEIDLMCRLSLVDWLANHLGEGRKPLLYEAVFAYDPQEKRQADEALARENLWPEFNRLLREVTVLDPACGSGSFLVGMLLVLDDLQERANRQLGIEETPYERRRRIIGQSLYGVDVMEWAVHVAELRLWLQLVIETELEPAELKFRPLLPNLSFKVRPGDSLVQELGGINFALHRRHLDIPKHLKGRLTRLKGEKLKFYHGEASHYGSETELKQAEFQLFREILENKAHALRNQIVTLTKRIEHPEQMQTLEGIAGEDRQLELRVEALRRERDELKGQLERIQEALGVLKTAEDVPFIWDIAFVEIFEGEKGGFDIVIGNPPYVRQERIAPPLLREEDFSPEEWRRLKAEYKAKLQQSACEIYPRFFKNRKPSGKSDYYIYFYLHGLSLLGEGGSFCFITSNSWLDVGYGRDLQEFLLKHGHVKLILDNQAKRSFAQADVNTIIALLGPPDDGRSEGLNNTARFVTFRVPFEEVLHPVIFEEIEEVQTQGGMARKETPDYRAIAISQRELYEEGLALPEADEEKRTKKMLKARRYVGDKWGGKYLRAPEIFFTILEKGEGKLVRLGEIAEVNEGRPTGANDFFYVPKHTATEFGIELEFLHEGLMKTRGFNRFVIRPADIDRFFLSVDLPRDQLKGTNVLRYIEYGEEQGLHTRSTFANKPEWYRFKVRRPAELVAPCGLGSTFFCAVNEAKAVSSNSYTEFRIKSAESLLPLWSMLNSVISWLQLEIVGRSSLGGGLLKVDPIEYRKLIVLQPFLLNQRNCQIEQTFHILTSRNVLSLFEEIHQPDRRALDEVVFDVLGLTRGEREAVYEAVVELVSRRLEKARSV